MDILAQFLVEAVTLSLLGGAVGAGVGLGAAYTVAYVARWQILIQPEAVLVAVRGAALIGVGFGSYPARRAARLDPIDAMRYE